MFKRWPPRGGIEYGQACMVCSRQLATCEHDQVVPTPTYFVLWDKIDDLIRIDSDRTEERFVSAQDKLLTFQKHQAKVLGEKARAIVLEAINTEVARTAKAVEEYRTRRGKLVEEIETLRESLSGQTVKREREPPLVPEEEGGAYQPFTEPGGICCMCGRYSWSSSKPCRCGSK